MTHRKSMARAMIDMAETSCSSPLRRKSIIAQKACSTPLDQNDDEAEILARRKEQELQRRSITSTPSTSSDRRRSMGLVGQLTNAQMTEQYQQCIKLCAENKINVKNAFGLQMIDFMTYMVKKKDTNMNNLQVASTTLDVSTKIYGCRVDYIHTDTLKMSGGFGKQGKKDDKNNEAAPNDEITNPENAAKKITKKKKTQKILCTPGSLCGTVEVLNPCSISEGDGDSQTADAMYQVTLPQHFTTRLQVPLFNDIVMDSLEDRKSERDKDPRELPGFELEEDIFDVSKICTPFMDLELIGWAAEDEPEEEVPPEPADENLQFDLDASIDDNHDHINSGINYFDVEENAENVDRCARQPGQIANIVDFRQALTFGNQSGPLEYSYLQKSIALHWAGPMHWKLRMLPKSLGGSRVMGACRQEAVRKRKEIILEFDENTEEAALLRFVSSQAVRLQARTARQNWQEETLTLPQDVHYNIENASKLYLHPGMVSTVKSKDRLNTTQLAADIANYDYDNENDRENYCPNVDTEDYAAVDDEGCQDDRGFDEDDPFTQALTGDNLVAAPKQTNTIFIPYSQRAKKIDMRQLKTGIWKLLTKPTSGKENIDITDNGEKDSNGVECTDFSQVYKDLPNLLTKTNAEALSFPIAFVSLLHLANEKTLAIESTKDMSDLIVKQG